MSIPQQIITIGLCGLATLLVRFLPFLIFREGRKTPKIIEYIGKVLPAAVFGMLIVYCLKDTVVTSYPWGIPELVGILVTALSYIWKKKTLISIALGTLVYMVLLHFMPQVSTDCALVIFSLI